MVSRMTSPVSRDTIKRSGVTSPDTTDSPSPQLDSTASSSGRVGLTVNMTPETSASIILCTTTAIASVASSMPWSYRYAIARSDHSDAQQVRIFSNNSDGSSTFRNVSCCPAKLASGRSSAVADERTATRPSPSCSYASKIADSSVSGISVI